MSIEGSPRPWMSDVREADWSPDGATMAIVHVMPTGDQLEYPIGKALYQTTGYISDPRVSPDGSRVAFMDHQQPFDDRGWVRVVDAAGTVTTLAGEFWGEEGLTWTADGTSVLFGANDRTNTDEKEAGDLSYQIRSVAVDRPGTSAAAVTGPADFTIHDVTRDGRWLVTRDDMRQGVGARLRGDTAERDLSWLNQNWGVSLSSDGSKLLFSDGTAGANYGVVWRNTDRSPIVRLGEGNAIRLSPDDQWALVQIFTPPQLVVYPLGAGETIHPKPGALEGSTDAMWFPDGQESARGRTREGQAAARVPAGASGRAAGALAAGGRVSRRNCRPFLPTVNRFWRVPRREAGSGIPSRAARHDRCRASRQTDRPSWSDGRAIADRRWSRRMARCRRSSRRWTSRRA